MGHWADNGYEPGSYTGRFWFGPQDNRRGFYHGRPLRGFVRFGPSKRRRFRRTRRHPARPWVAEIEREFVTWELLYTARFETEAEATAWIRDNIDAMDSAHANRGTQIA